MKNAFKQIGKALCYLAYYFGLQIMVTVVATLVYMFLWGMSLGAKGEKVTPAVLNSLDQDAMINAITPWVLIVSTALTLLGLWLFFLIRKKRFLQEIEARPFPVKDIPGVLCASAGLYLLIAFGMPLLPLSDEMWEAYLESSSSLAGFSIPLAISNVIAAPVVEEVTFRGLMFGRMKKAMPVWLAALISSLIFGLMHGQILWMSYAFLLGLVCCLTVYKTNSILASLIIHMIFNLFGSILSFLTDGIPDTAYGPIALVGGVVLVVAVVLLWPRDQREAPEPAA